MAPADIESRASKDEAENVPKMGTKDADVNVKEPGRFKGLWSLLSRLEKRGAVELNGSAPVPYEDRTVTEYFNIFTLWFCLSCNPLP